MRFFLFICFLALCFPAVSTANTKSHQLQIINQLNIGPYLDWAYFSYHVPLGQNPDKDYVISLLRLHGLWHESLEAENMVNKMKESGINNPDFFQMAEDAISWAEVEKQKSGEQLYNLSKTISKKIHHEELKDNYERAYLLLSANKKFSPAIKELKHK